MHRPSLPNPNGAGTAKTRRRDGRVGGRYRLTMRARTLDSLLLTFREHVDALRRDALE